MTTNTISRMASVARRATCLAIVSALAVMFSTTAASAADDGSERSRMELARQAFSVGALEEAVRLYEEMLADEPDNQRALWGLVKSYEATDRVESGVIPLLEDWLRRRPEDMSVRMELGRGYAEIGSHDVAHELWTQVLEHGTSDAGRYSEIGAQEIRFRMYDQALDTFTRGREAFRSESIFSQELTQVHALLGDFGSAIDECLVTVGNHRGAVQWATNRIELMLEEGASRDEVLARMAAMLDAEEATGEALSLAGSVLLVMGVPDRALEAFLRADEVTEGHGRELLEYGSILRGEGLHDEARVAYLMVSERHPGTSSAATAGVAAARILAAAGDPSGAVTELRAIADSFDGSSNGADALFDVAKIELDVLHDPEAALATVAELRERFGARARKLAGEASLIEVDAFMSLGRLDEAYARTQSLIGLEVRSDIREGAMFALGFISFLRHDHEKAVEEFRVMVEAEAAGKLVNDALRLMLLIVKSQDADNLSPVDMLADAHAVRIAGDAAASRDILRSILDASPVEAVETEVLLMLGSSAHADRDYDEALGFYDRIIAGAEAVTTRAEAMMRKGDILSGVMGREREAIEQYTAILEELPQNPLAGEARRKVDRLRRGEGAKR